METSAKDDIQAVERLGQARDAIVAELRKTIVGMVAREVEGLRVGTHRSLLRGFSEEFTRHPLDGVLSEYLSDARQR